MRRGRLRLSSVLIPAVFSTAAAFAGGPDDAVARADAILTDPAYQTELPLRGAAGRTARRGSAGSGASSETRPRAGNDVPTPGGEGEHSGPRARAGSDAPVTAAPGAEDAGSEPRPRAGSDAPATARRPATPARTPPTPARGLAQIAMLVFLVLLAAAFVAGLVAAAAAWLRRRPPPEPEVELPAPPDDAPPRPPPGLDELLAAGDYAAALRLLLARALARLEERRGAPWPASVTGREVLREAALEAGEREALAELVAAVERSLFGGAPVDRAAYERAAAAGGRLAGGRTG